MLENDLVVSYKFLICCAISTSLFKIPKLASAKTSAEDSVVELATYVSSFLTRSIENFSTLFKAEIPQIQKVQLKGQPRLVSKIG